MAFSLRLALAALSLVTLTAALAPEATAALCDQPATPVWDFALDCANDARDLGCERLEWLQCDILGGPFCLLSC